MLQRYELAEMVAKKAEAAPPLVKMARITAIPRGTARAPCMVEYFPDREEADEEMREQ